MQSDKLPKMPDPKAYWVGDVLSVGGAVVTGSAPAFTAKQMQDYALAARKAALEEVLEEVERRHAMAWDEYKVQFLGAHSEGQADALDSLSSFVEAMAKEIP